MSQAELLEFAKSLAFKAGVIISEGYRSEVAVERKAELDFVTRIDKESEQLIRDAIAAKYPTHGFLGEESGSSHTNAEYVWVVDPLDGTTNFVYKIPYFAVSIGLKHKGEAIVGVVYNPLTNEMFYAEKGKGAFLNDKPLRIRDPKPQAKWFLAFCFRDNMKHEEAERIVFDAYYFHIARLLKLGSAALELCYVAAGRVDGYIGLTLKEWDYCAGELIAKEAGAAVTHDKLIEKDILIAAPKENAALISSQILNHNEYHGTHDIG
jgi:myo-inositol-1(or 4)-monophosphatase